MSVGFFGIIFECNSHESCVECKHKGNGCHEFCSCFDGTIPCELWRKVTSVDDILSCFDKWGEYQNEQTIE